MSDSDLGRDISCTTSLRTGRFVTKARLVAEAAYRRITTPRGMLRGGEEEANYGIDITAVIGSDPKRVAKKLPVQIRAELQKDERLLTVTVDLVSVKNGPATIFLITIRATTADGPFTLSVKASAVTVELLGITAEAA